MDKLNGKFPETAAEVRPAQIALESFDASEPFDALDMVSNASRAAAWHRSATVLCSCWGHAKKPSLHSASKPA
jgi:hypothetical protein